MADMAQDISIFGPLAATFVLAVSTILLCIWYSIKKQQYWKEKGVPSAKAVPILGSIWEIRQKPSHEIEMERYKKCGPIYGFYEGNRPVLSVANPALLKNIFVKDFHNFPGPRKTFVSDDATKHMLGFKRGEDWKRIRSILSPTFTTGKLKRLTGIFKQCAESLSENFRNYAEKGEPIDIKSLYGTFTMDVIASSAFSTKIDSHKDPNNEFVQNAKIAFSFNLNWRFLLFFLWPSFRKYIKVSLFPPKAMEFFATVTRQIIVERKRTGQIRNDFLQLLLDTAKEVEEGRVVTEDNENDDIAANYGMTDGEQLIKNITVKKSLSLDEIVAQCVTFFIAGYETTATTLSFATYLLALNPDIQEKLIEEVDEVLSKANGELTYQAIQNMKYLDNIISETLRIYPPAIRLERMAENDYKLGNTGITVPKDMVVSIPVYAIHRDPKFYPNPEKFDPDRFNPEERAKRDPFTYIPFGSGPRNCVAMRFALLEVKVCLAYVISHFRIKKCEETDIPLKFLKAQFFLQPKITLKMEVRKDGIEVH